MLAPLRFEPYVRPLVWGGRRLGDILGKNLTSSEPHGEAWEISDHPLHHSVVACGSNAGRTLHDLLQQDAASLLGAAHAKDTVFPWLVKFLDAYDWLSVQVHPDEQAVRRLWSGEGSKTEAWFVLDALPGCRIYAGLLPGTDAVALRKALAAGTAAECLYSFVPRPGDCIFLPAGTVHAVGGGVLIAEVQQTSDATYRLFDWNRRDAHGKMRQLHIDEGLASIHWHRGPVQPVHAKAFSQSPESAAATEKQLLVQCPYFTLDYVQFREPTALGGTGRLQALVVVRGQARWDGQDGAEPVATGHAWLLPASMPATRIKPEPCVGAVLCTLP